MKEKERKIILQGISGDGKGVELTSESEEEESEQEE